jgi:hypothetical protein
MPFSLFIDDSDWEGIETMMKERFDSCPLQEMLLIYARAFTAAAWVPANVWSLPALLKAWFASLPEKMHAALEAAIQAHVAMMNTEMGWSLPIPELTAEWAWE